MRGQLYAHPSLSSDLLVDRKKYPKAFIGGPERRVMVNRSESPLHAEKDFALFAAGRAPEIVKRLCCPELISEEELCGLPTRADEPPPRKHR
jgi:hypothetical protein